MADYSMLSPYLVPPEIRSWKAVNIGDGFIARSISDSLTPHVCRFTLSTRQPLSEEAIDQINSTRLLVLAGANQLTDSFTVAPGMDAAGLSRIRVPILPFGIGIHGVPRFNQGMSPESKAILRALHERVRYSSWRCPQTVDYLVRECPEISSQVLMTCCPVAFREPLVGSTPFTSTNRRIVVTITERDEFWRRETRTIDFVSRAFPQAEKILSLHQIFPSSPRQRGWRAALTRWRGKASRTPQDLHTYAERRGFSIFRPETVEECWKFYESCDAHFGSRLHAHLFFLSKARRSYLTYVDNRCVGISQVLRFPLCDPEAWERSLDFDFRECRIAARQCRKTMDQFLSSAKELLA